MMHMACLHLQKTSCPTILTYLLHPHLLGTRNPETWARMWGGGLPSPWQLCSAILAVVPVHVASQDDVSACVFFQHLKRLRTI